MLFGTLYVAGAQGLAIMGSLIVLIAAAEFTALFERINPWFFIFLVCDIAIYLTYLLAPNSTLPMLSALFVILSATAVILYRNSEPQQILSKLQWSLWGLIYTGLFPAFTVGYLLSQGPRVLIYLLVTVFLGDVAAFFCGRYIGGPKIFPNVSPKKTVSGAIGGLLASGIGGSAFLLLTAPAAGLTAICMDPLFSPTPLFAGVPDLLILVPMSLAIGFFAQFGDFFESLVKRVAGKKDSGQLMPGHGGLLDRLDGVYFGSAVLFFFCTGLNYLCLF